MSPGFVCTDNEIDGDYSSAMELALLGSGLYDRLSGHASPIRVYQSFSQRSGAAS